MLQKAWEWNYKSLLTLARVKSLFDKRNKTQ